MKTLVHISDLHFGCIDESLLAPLRASIEEIKPALIAISGDLTQRARAHQFKAARAFLHSLKFPQLVVPGNHDIPLYNLAARFFWPLRNYRRHIRHELAPLYADFEIVVAGINTARSLTIKDGRISDEQIEQTRNMLCAYNEDIVKIIVTHHPFDLPEGAEDHRDIVGRARLAVQRFAACGADVFLSGHMHQSHIGSTAVRYGDHGEHALIVHAGTATSVRQRGFANGFNVLHVESKRIVLEHHEWSTTENTFKKIAARDFVRTEKGWLTEAPAPSQAMHG